MESFLFIYLFYLLPIEMFPSLLQIRILFLPYRYPLSLYPCCTSALAHPTNQAHKVAVVIPIYKASKYIATRLYPLPKSIFVQSLILT